MELNLTTARLIPPSAHRADRSAYAIIPCLLLILVGCAVAAVHYLRRRARMDELRHRLVPLYTYDPTEDEEWDDTNGEEEEELTEPLYKEARLSFSSGSRS